MSSDRLMRIHSDEFQAMAERVLQVTELTSASTSCPSMTKRAKQNCSSRSSASRCRRE